MNKNKILIVVGLALAVIATLAMLKFNNVLEKKVPVVVVTKRVMPADTLSSKTNIKLVNISPKYVLPSAATSLDQVEGMVAKVPMYPEEQIVIDKVNPKKIIPGPNEKYFLIPLKGVTIKPGEKIDVWFDYIPGKSPYSGTECLLRGKTVNASLDSQGRPLFDPATGAPNPTVTSQASLEIIVTNEEIQKYIERDRYADKIIVRHGPNTDSSPEPYPTPSVVSISASAEGETLVEDPNTPVSENQSTEEE